MFKALGMFFQLIFLLVLFKMFAPELYTLGLDIVYKILVIINQVLDTVQQNGGAMNSLGL